MKRWDKFVKNFYNLFFYFEITGFMFKLYTNCIKFTNIMQRISFMKWIKLKLFEIEMICFDWFPLNHFARVFEVIFTMLVLKMKTNWGQWCHIVSCERDQQKEVISCYFP